MLIDEVKVRACVQPDRSRLISILIFLVVGYRFNGCLFASEYVTFVTMPKGSTAIKITNANKFTQMSKCSLSSSFACFYTFSFVLIIIALM